MTTSNTTAKNTLQKLLENQNSALCIIFLLLLTFLSTFSINVKASEISTQRQQELLHLLKHDCGSCHGMTLKGGLGPDLTTKRLNLLIILKDIYKLIH